MFNPNDLGFSVDYDDFYPRNEVFLYYGDIRIPLSETVEEGIEKLDQTMKQIEKIKKEIIENFGG